jgi:hypothetical protein
MGRIREPMGRIQEPMGQIRTQRVPGARAHRPRRRLPRPSVAASATSSARRASMNAASSPPRSGWVRSAAARNARLISAAVAPGATPSTPSAHVLLPAGTTLAASRGAPASRGAGHGGSPRSTRTHAPAHRASISTRLRPAARSAWTLASAGVRAPPLDASGLRNGSASGGAVHQAAHKKRRRFVGTTE